MMVWDSHDPQARKNYTTEKSSIFSTRKTLAHNNMSLVHTHSPVTVPQSKPKLTYVTSDPPSQLNGQ